MQVQVQLMQQDLQQRRLHPHLMQLFLPMQHPPVHPVHLQVRQLHRLAQLMQQDLQQRQVHLHLMQRIVQH